MKLIFCFNLDKTELMTNVSELRVSCTRPVPRHQPTGVAEKRTCLVVTTWPGPAETETTVGPVWRDMSRAAVLILTPRHVLPPTPSVETPWWRYWALISEPTAHVRALLETSENCLSVLNIKDFSGSILVLVCKYFKSCQLSGNNNH